MFGGGGGEGRGESLLKLFLTSLGASLLRDALLKIKFIDKAREDSLERYSYNTTFATEH